MKQEEIPRECTEKRDIGNFDRCTYLERTINLSKQRIGSLFNETQKNYTARGSGRANGYCEITHKKGLADKTQMQDRLQENGEVNI